MVGMKSHFRLSFSHGKASQEHSFSWHFFYPAIKKFPETYVCNGRLLQSAGPYSELHYDTKCGITLAGGSTNRQRWWQADTVAGGDSVKERLWPAETLAGRYAGR